MMFTFARSVPSTDRVTHQRVVSQPDPRRRLIFDKGRVTELDVDSVGSARWLAENVGTDHGAELATYVVEKGKPLITLVK